MSVRSVHRFAVCSAAVAVATSLGACGQPNPSQAYTGPGWYLERSYIITVGGPQVFGGPFTYEKCEEERIKLGPQTSPEMICANHPGKPKNYGMF